MSPTVFAAQALERERPARLQQIVFPRRQTYHASPVDWRNEILYFLLVDRFSDGLEAERPLLDRRDLASARPGSPDGEAWRWDRWAESGAERWQGGSLRGVRSKLPYLKTLGVTTLWLSPVFKQRGHENSYHGYGVQDFLDVDPRFGTRRDLVELVAAAHEAGMRIILDVIFNHSGFNWTYPPGTPGGEATAAYLPYHDGQGDRYPFGAWRGDEGQPIATVTGGEDGVWPVELQDTDHYTRAGSGDLGAGDIADPHAEHKRSDFITLRDFELDSPGHLSDLIACYKYWIALTDCDGFRIDTLKHVTLEEARNFCGAIKEFAAALGKDNFLLVGEIAGGDYNQDRYLSVLAQNLNAALDIGEMRLDLNGVAKGYLHPRDYFDGFNPGNAVMGSHRQLGNRHVSILNDHDHVFGEKIRFASEADSEHQVAAGVALQLLTLGIPCLYYGTEQALGGPESDARQWLPGWKSSDRYLRETMFGAPHPRASGRAGAQSGPDGFDQLLPGFGPLGTAGRHCFDVESPVFRRIAALCAARNAFAVLRDGRQYLRPTSFLNLPFYLWGPGEIIAWSRILDDTEALCVVNGHGREARGADIVVDARLNGASDATFTIVLNSAEAADRTHTGSQRVGTTLAVQQAADGTAFIAIRDLPPSEILILLNHPEIEPGRITE